MHPSLSGDIEIINHSLLLSAIECARDFSPRSVVHRFSLNQEQALELTSLTEEKARQISACGRSLFKPMPCDSVIAENLSPCVSCELNEKISSNCYDLLVLIRECARTTPMEAVWKFNMTMDNVKTMANTPLSDLREWSENHVLRLCILPHKTPDNVSPGVHAMLYKSNPDK